MRGLIQQRLKLAGKADYTNARDVQNFIQEMVDRESLIEWARRDDVQRVKGVVPPSRMYEPVKEESFLRRLLGLIP